MRCVILIKASADSEAGVMPSQELLAAMGQFNEELVAAGLMQAGEGLQPSSKGARVRFAGSERRVIDGPFAETKELVAGFWVWKVDSLAQAIEWVKRCPNPMPGESEIEIRPVFEAEDFGESFTPELREQEERLRERIATQAGVAPVPEPSGATPYLTIRGAGDAIAFYQRVFAAEQLLRLDAPDGLLHAELKIGPARFMLSEERPQYGALSPLSLGGSGSCIVAYVPDADAAVARALAAGARLDMPVQDQFWGDRAGQITDPFGHKWMVATRREAPTPEQLRARVQQMFDAGQAGGCPGAPTS